MRTVRPQTASSAPPKCAREAVLRQGRESGASRAEAEEEGRAVGRGHSVRKDSHGLGNRVWQEQRVWRWMGDEVGQSG